MHTPAIDISDSATADQLRRASNCSLASLLNLTFLPGLAFIYLLFIYIKSNNQGIDHYHASLGIKLNIFAAFSLIIISWLMIILGGFDSAWTWVYVITYFTFVHTVFILIAVWAMIRAWSGQEFRDKNISSN